MAAAAPIAAGPATPTADEYAFLVGSHIDTATLERARRLAAHWNAATHEVLIANGWIAADAYYRAFAKAMGADFVEPHQSALLHPATRRAGARQCLKAGLLQRVQGGKAGLVLTPASRPLEFRRMLLECFGPRPRIAIAAPGALRDAVLRSYSRALLDRALNGLAKRYRDECAASLVSPRQWLALAVLAAAACGGAALAPWETLRVLAASAALFFCAVVSLRVAAGVILLRSPPGRTASKPHRRIPDAELPVYSILVPLYREPHMVAGLVAALSRLDYPATKLDIMLVLEACDQPTRAAAAMLDLPARVEIVTVPDALPRTKPKALNYALQLARGEFAVIYDAEDRPAPDQLREALAAFRAGPPNLACVQARLNVYNAQENWLTGQFALEYAALFDGLLPTLERFRLPLPLGGTSNHFRGIMYQTHQAERRASQ